MLLNGLTFPAVADTLRSLFVEVAANDILTDRKSRTDSRMSLLTGVHRKEIRRLRETPATVPDIVTLASQVIERWLGTAAFRDEAGRPLPLPRGNSRIGDVPSFDALVEATTRDIRPRAALDDLLGRGVVYLDADDRVHLGDDASISGANGEGQLFDLAQNLHDHIAAAMANVTAPGVSPFLDRSVRHDRLTPEQATELEAYARAAAIRVVQDVNRRALELAGSGLESNVIGRRRLYFGVYLFSDTDGWAAEAVS